MVKARLIIVIIFLYKQHSVAACRIIERFF